MSARLAQIHQWEILAKEARFRPSALAALCPTSLRQLERYFAGQFHKTPGEWSRELRYRSARGLLARGWSTKAVAAELGFADSAHLCREFKRMCGTSPQSYG